MEAISILLRGFHLRSESTASFAPCLNPLWMGTKSKRASPATAIANTSEETPGAKRKRQAAQHAAAPGGRAICDGRVSAASVLDRQLQSFKQSAT